MPDQTPAPGGTPGGGTPAPTTPWHQGVDADLVGAWQNKGYDLSDPVKVAIESGKAWREAEKMVGVPRDQLLRLPAKPDDDAGWKNVWQRLGAPADAKDYDFSTVKYGDGQDLEPSFTEALRGAFAARHVTKEAARDITAAVVKWLGDADAAAELEANGKRSAQLASLDQKWGAQKDANLLQAVAGARRLGLSQDQIKGMEQVLGYDNAAELFRRIGASTNEDTFVDGGNRSGTPATVEAAQSRINDLKADPDFQKRYLRGEPAAKREMAALLAQITGVNEAAELAALGRMP